MTTPNETTAVAIRDSLIGRELAINVRAEPPVYRAGEIELLANSDLTAEVLNVPLDEYYQSLPAILGEDWYTDMNNLDQGGHRGIRRIVSPRPRRRGAGRIQHP